MRRLRKSRRVRTLEPNPIVGNLGEPRRAPRRRRGAGPVAKAVRKLKRTLKRITI
jgi:hypothetical protein